MSVTLWLVFVLLTLVTSVSSKDQYVQPLNMGMQMAIPYDIANLFVRPIAGVTSVVLSIGLAVILFLGVITSPFGYFFGIPSRKYVMGGEPASEPTASRSLGHLPEFTKDTFWLLPLEFNDRSCQHLITCYAHGALRHLPQKVTKAYTFFSKNLVNIDADFERAIQIGLENSAHCIDLYASCDKSIFSIVINTFIQFLPARARRRTQPTVFS